MAKPRGAGDGNCFTAASVFARLVLPCVWSRTTRRNAGLEEPRAWGVWTESGLGRRSEAQTSGEVLFQVTLCSYEITTKGEEWDWPRAASSCASAALSSTGQGLPGSYRTAGGRSWSVARRSCPAARMAKGVQLNPMYADVGLYEDILSDHALNGWCRKKHKPLLCCF